LHHRVVVGDLVEPTVTQQVGARVPDVHETPSATASSRALA
jgi:hypothetical protein